MNVSEVLTDNTIKATVLLETLEEVTGMLRNVDDQDKLEYVSGRLESVLAELKANLENIFSNPGYVELLGQQGKEIVANSIPEDFKIEF